MNEKIRLVIADDHPLLRKGLKYTIQSDEQLEVIAEASDGWSAISLIEQYSPDVAVLDVEMPGCNGLTVAETVLPKMKNLKIIFLTAHAEPEVLKRAVEIGVKGYLLKDSMEEEIFKAIRIVCSGSMYISPVVSGHLLNMKNEEPAPAIHRNLTRMEHKIILLIAHNKITSEIADELCISERTVDRHRSNICKKLNLTGNNVLTKYALENKEIIFLEEN